jgi:hypothetical protein
MPQSLPCDDAALGRSNAVDALGDQDLMVLAKDECRNAAR